MSPSIAALVFGTTTDPQGDLAANSNASELRNETRNDPGAEEGAEEEDPGYEQDEEDFGDFSDNEEEDEETVATNDAVFHA